MFDTEEARRERLAARARESFYRGAGLIIAGGLLLLAAWRDKRLTSRNP